ncbi:MAG TPA: molybdopterin-synthase adenylyltransferase MoeB [Solirubrobacterales bacterium]|jgi:molybdopterin/thiamine biosynthesis adenylyltransferase/rhodanese-related sulfurtransferase|nr:molybdopterin-synthase adenylyltransferase MoeB [Solirubrobacterales bacterium]
MASNYQDYLKSVKDRVLEVDPQEVADILETRPDDAVIVDVREQNEWDESHVPGAHHVSRSFLEQRIGRVAPDPNERVILYCQSGNRSALAAATLIDELGYENVESMAGGITSWKQRALPLETPFQYTDAQRIRYSRHMLLPEVGAEGQQKLLESKVLLLGAGGLGAPVALYLAAAGVGTLGIVDDDVVDASNLQRQVIHSTATIGEPKVESAKKTIEGLNPDVNVVTYNTRINADNILDIIKDYDIIVDGVDNFPTRYLLNDATVRLNIPVVSASILAFDGQLTIFKPFDGPCYRCLYPVPPPPELAPSCGDNGVLGVLPGTMGLLQATEVLKLILEIGDPLVGRLLLYDALAEEFTNLKIRRDPECPICSRDPETISDDEMGKFPDYDAFCTGVTV